MKSTTFSMCIIFIALLCCSWNFRISDAAFDLRIQQHDAHSSSSNAEWICSSDVDCTTPDSTCVENRCQCRPNYIFNTAMTSCLKAATAYGDACEDTTQCTAYLLAGGNCDDGICSCVKGYHYLHGRCIKSSGLKGKCHSDDECYVNADYEALSCTNNVCLCSDGFYQREYRTCRREAKEIGAECMIDLDCTFDKNAHCDKVNGCFMESESTENTTLREIVKRVLRTAKVQAVLSDIVVGSDCKNDKECEVLGAAACDAADKCICKPGHFANDELTACVPELGEKCEANDIASIKKSICRDGRWSCDKATVPSRNNRICRKVTTVYNTSCVFDEQCYVFGPDAFCLNKKCVCNENSHYSEESMFCWINRGIDEACKIDEDCYVNGFGSKLACKESVCACPVGTRINAAGTECINDIPALGDPCTADTDCSSLLNAICSNGTCVCADNHFDQSGNCVSGISSVCTVDDQCKTPNSTCVWRRCRCTDGLVSPSPGLCVPVSHFGYECQYDVQCSATVPGALCTFPEVPEVEEHTISRSESNKGICTCAAGQHYKYKRCYPMKVLQEPCDSRGQCYVESSPDSVMCLKGVCTCEWDAVQVSRTFCEMSGSTKTVLSSSIFFTLLVVSFIGFVR